MRDVPYQKSDRDFAWTSVFAIRIHTRKAEQKALQLLLQTLIVRDGHVGSLQSSRR
jgi:hypothetical protein